MATPSSLRGNSLKHVLPHRYITVGARVRPESEVEKAIDGALTGHSESCCLSRCKNGDVGLSCDGADFPLHFVTNAASAKLEAQLGPFMPQDGELARNITHHMLDGDDCLVMAYGGVESGKHHTILGSFVDPSRAGLLPRVAQELMSKVQQVRSHQMSAAATVENIAKLSPHHRAASSGKGAKTKEAAPAGAAGNSATLDSSTGSNKKKDGGDDGDDDENDFTVPFQHAIAKHTILFRAWEVLAQGGAVQDLLVDPEYRPAGGLTVRPLPAGTNSGFYVPDLLWQSCESVEEIENLVKIAADRVTKKKSGDGIAPDIGRSHVFYQLLYEKILQDGGRDHIVVEAASTFVILAPHSTQAAALAASVSADAKTTTTSSSSSSFAATTHAVSHKGHALQDDIKHLAHVVHQAAAGAPTAEIDYKSSTLTKILQHNIEAGFMFVLGCMSPSVASKAAALDTLAFLKALMASPHASPAQKTSAANNATPSSDGVKAELTPEQLKAKRARPEIQQLQQEIDETFLKLVALKRLMAKLMSAN